MVIDFHQIYLCYIQIYLFITIFRFLLCESAEWNPDGTCSFIIPKRDFYPNFLEHIHESLPTTSFYFKCFLFFLFFTVQSYYFLHSFSVISLFWFFVVLYLTIHSILFYSLIHIYKLFSHIRWILIKMDIGTDCILMAGPLGRGYII